MSPKREAAVGHLFPLVMVGRQLSGRIFFSLTIEIIIQCDRPSPARNPAGGGFHFGGGQEESAYAFGIISHHFLAQVVLVTSIAIGSPAETGDAYRASEIDLSVCFSFDELLHDSLIALLGDLEVRGR